MKIIETEKFFNTGYGWICKRCAKRDKTDEMQNQKLNIAKWQDKSGKRLYCPRCGATEEIDKA